MRRLIACTALLSLFAIPTSAQDVQLAADAVGKAPVAAKQPTVSTIHGYTRTDEYFWLRDRSNPAVRQYLEAENA